jgi:hypothetical protein
MSALGQKQTFAPQKVMSALPPIATAKADIAHGPTHSCSGARTEWLDVMKQISSLSNAWVLRLRMLAAWLRNAS